jgi:RNA polymerase sigma factor (sigma-70 family)
MSKESAESPINHDRKLGFSEATPDDLRQWCFGNELNPTWKQPGQSLASRKICLLIRKRVYSSSPLEPEDLFQEVYERVWRNFDKIETGFRNSGSLQTLTNFEKWLHTTLDHYLVDAIRGALPPPINPRNLTDEYGGEQMAEYLPDPNRERRLSEWNRQALATLSYIEKNLLVGRLVNGHSVDELASAFGETKATIYRKVYEAKLKFRNEIIRLVVVEHLTRHPDLDAQLQSVITSRCEIGKPCYMYRVNCPEARSAERLAQGELKDITADEVKERLALMQTTVESLLDDWDLGRTLDRCFWAVK